MIKTENYEINGVPFVRTYSDANRYVVRDGIAYDEAHDPASFGRTYTEGDVIQDDDDAETAESITRTLLEDGVIELPEQEQPDYFHEDETEPNYFE